MHKPHWEAKSHTITLSEWEWDGGDPRLLRMIMGLSSGLSTDVFMKLSLLDLLSTCYLSSGLDCTVKRASLKSGVSRGGKMGPWIIREV